MIQYRMIIWSVSEDDTHEKVLTRMLGAENFAAAHIVYDETKARQSVIRVQQRSVCVHSEVLRANKNFKMKLRCIRT